MSSIRKTFLKSLAIVTMALSASFAFCETYTLSIGINDYPTVKGEDGKDVDNDLKGCVNDAVSMRDLFVDSFDVKKSNTRLLTDKDATVDKFVENMKWLLTSAKAGDQVVFSYSGHGAQVKDDKEADGIQEVIVLADMQLVPGDLFGEIAKMLTLNGVNCTFIFDSCFSGGMSRDVSGKLSVRSKSMGVVKPRGTAPSVIAQKVLRLAPKAQNRAMADTKAQSVFLFASKEDKPSSDISGLEGIDPHGLFTLLLLGVLEEDAETPVKDLYDGINSILDGINSKLKEQNADRQFDQGPNFETSASRAAGPIILK